MSESQPLQPADILDLVAILPYPQEPIPFTRFQDGGPIEVLNIVLKRIGTTDERLPKGVSMKADERPQRHVEFRIPCIVCGRGTVVVVRSCVNNEPRQFAYCIGHVPPTMRAMIPAGKA